MGAALVAFVWLSVCDTQDAGAVTLQLTAGGALPLTQTTGPGDAGLTGAASFAFHPLISTPEIQLAVAGSYSRFLSGVPERSVRTVATGGMEIHFMPDQMGNQRWYLLLGAGVAYADKQFTTITDPFGCAGAGAEIGPEKKMHLIVEARLTDISNSRYGDFRYFSLLVGIKF